jgi:hypothetical protein
MLVEKMLDHEVKVEILKDFDILYNGNTLLRLHDKYNRERIVKKINKVDSYDKTYRIKTKSKNNWLVLMQKVSTKNKYQSKYDISVCTIVYYYTNIGLRAFKVDPDGKVVVYNGHLFKRYNERLGLGIIDPIEIIEHFFQRSGYIFGESDHGVVISVCHNGYVLGEDYKGVWTVYKTFLSDKEAGNKHKKVEKRLISDMYQ